MRKSKIKQISLAVCLALMPFAAYSAGLGKLYVNSGLGEPLKADIELLSVTAEELSSLVASIASEDAYASQGITRLGIHNNIQVEIAKKADGSAILKLRSNQPISEPYLDVLIQVDWATGRLQREYTVLLDPPGYKQAVDSSDAILASPPAVNTTASSSAGASSNVNGAQPSIKKSKKQARIVSVAIEPSEKEVVSDSGQDLTTKRGDTLSSVAKDLQIEGVSLDQMLVGLYENNKAAFTSGNINRLKVGQIIKVPSKESLTSIDAQEAKKSVKMHSENWRAYRNALATNVESSHATSEVEQKQTSSGRIVSTEDKSTPVKIGPQDVVKLSSGSKEAAKVPESDNKALDSKIVALQEEATARDKSLTEAKDRVSALEKQIQDMQKLLALKNQSMTDLQKNAERATKSLAVKPESNPLDSASATDLKVKKSAPSQPIKTKEKPLPELGFFESLMNSVDLVVLGGASGIALLVAAWMFLRNKRRKDLDGFERSILTSGGLNASTVFGNTRSGTSSSNTSFLTDFSQNPDGSMIDTNDVDPIAESEVYMAYGRDAQAEEILKDAILKEPKRYELHLKLLKMYASRKGFSAFEAIAGELYTTLGADDPVWKKVAGMGAILEPDNPLYDLSSMTDSTTLAAEKLETSDFSTDKLPADTSLDFLPIADSREEPEEAVEDANDVLTQNLSKPNDDLEDISYNPDVLDKSVPDNITNENDHEGVISVEITQDSPLDESLGFGNAFASNLEADKSMNFDIAELAIEAPVAVEAQDAAGDLAVSDTQIMDTEDTSIRPIDVVEVAESIETEAPNFDMDFTLSADDVPNVVEPQPEAASNLIDDISFDLDFALDEPNDGTITENGNADTEISFDFPSIEESVAVVPAVATSQNNDFEANVLDLSSISLDLGETEAELFTEAPSSAASAENEPQDVNVKLDLVAAYIDMDDREGARELLEEVMKEGGTQQKARAQDLLDTLV